ncbi:hypothetical protein A5790_02675 [Mycobacterium sp. 852002-51152_SCH6134967]|uniref:DUF6884 domain-containing protein n=1 Tax=Mycobacterium sp. 852002-51152_SCH6134967 TaxID=1834096 RepID=UPI0007FED815|nr:DUF6884 domain-containing protein [Mycobacterium sp. 852002-51152_SCH6134967]OBF98655.1 hypothetical protein A5790_02675 [Mycobacterium sp. 852002-51152_SCH6134967]
MIDNNPVADIILVTCVKTKAPRPSTAKNLYTSPLFKKQRAYAEKASVPWFILSAEHGLVAPDEWLAPYERYLPETPASYRKAWGIWVAARLELLAGPLQDKIIEIHAGSAYLDVVRPELENRGAHVVDPLDGLQMGPRLAWYGNTATELDRAADDVERCVQALSDVTAALSPQQFIDRGRTSSDSPGLYSWWVDKEGADDLSRGLGLEVRPGLIYAGLAGATRWPSGVRSNNTLWLRVMTMHLGGNHEFSTFRRTLGAIVAHSNGVTQIDEEGLTRWMHSHLRLVTIPYDDRDSLGRLERDVLAELDPPLNLQHMTPTPIRRRLKQLRRAVMN